MLCLLFRGTSGIDIDLRRVDINQCASSVEDDGVFNIFGGTDKCKTESTKVKLFFLFDANQLFYGLD